MNYSHFVIEGHAGNDPEMRYTPKGTAVTNFNVACNVGWGDNEETIWYRVTVWGKLAEIVTGLVKKGSHVLVAGDRFAVETWEGNDGTQRHTNALTARTVRVLGSRGNKPSPVAADADDVEDFPF
jgi:single-strand DNA-binding protein